MYPCTGFHCGSWWIFLIIMIAMAAICFFMMRGHMGSMMCGPHSKGTDSHSRTDASDYARDILDRRYARGEINRDEYDEKIRGISQRR